MAADGSGASKGYKGVREDYVDLRDQVYSPSLGILPPELWPDPALLDPADAGRLATGIRQQQADPTCVGHALAGLIDIQRRLQGVSAPERVSAHMLYQMARFHESYDRDGVRTLRSAIKAFHHHGACLSSGARAPGARDDRFWPDDQPYDRFSWPTDAQAREAEERTLGAYYRLAPLLNHYHAAVRDSHAILVSAEIHDGWRNLERGVISFDLESAASLGTHAFLIVGYTREGFLVLNSWGEGWGGYPLPIGAEEVAVSGIALWTYDDWSRTLRDGWVLRLGVPGREAFASSAGERGLAEGWDDATGRATPSMPFRELRGHFLNLEDGACVGSGPYATPASALDQTLDGLRAAVADPRTKGVVIRLPGVLEPMEESFAHAVRQKNATKRLGLLDFTCFWCAELATDMNQILRDIFRRCSARAGADAEHLDRLFEEAARNAGRAFWREIERNARDAVVGPARPSAAAPGSEARGPFGRVFDGLVEACRAADKPFHIVADGAGALVLAALVEREQARSGGQGLPPGFPLPRSFALTLPALTMARAARTVLPLAQAIERRHAGSALILVPEPEFERRLTVHGYSGSILHLVANAFLEAGTEPEMLGMADAAKAGASPVPRTFETFSRKGTAQVEQSALHRDPDLQKRIWKHIEANQRTLERTHASPSIHPSQRAKEPSMDTIDLTELRERIAEGTLTPEEAERYLIVEETAPFSPEVRVNPDTVRVPRSALALNVLNRTARHARRARFHDRISRGYSGVRIAAEGDSWFQYPVLLDDVIDRVAKDYAVLCTSEAGDLLEVMARKREYIRAIEESEASVLLLSAGGNDLCAGGALAHHLEAFQPGLKPADYLKRSYQGLLDNAIAWYERICRDARGHFPDLTIVCHGYDYAVPNDGRWLGRPMESRGILDRGLQRAIAVEMVDQLNRALRRMAETLPGVVYVDCRGAVPSEGWHDELHPRGAGFRAVADRLLAAIREATGVRAAPGEVAAPSLIRAEARAVSLHVGVNEVDPAHYAGWRGELRGCENDARAMRSLAQGEGFDATLLLTRDATREAVVAEIERAARELRAGDQFVLSVSSHGSRITDFNGDERIEEGKRNPDSTLCLHDCQIIDDELFHLWSRFEAGVRILLLADCCHSGSVARASLPPVSFLDAPDVAGLQALALRPSIDLRPRQMPEATAREVLHQNEGFYRQMAGQFRHVNERILESPIQTSLKASVLQISACQDDQVAYDGNEHGVFTAALLRVWDRGGFRGSHDEFHSRIVTEVERIQRPNLLRLPPIDPAYAQQRPFTVRGAGGCDEPTSAWRPTTSASRPTIDELLVGEGDERDVPEPAPAGARAATPPAPDPEVVARFVDHMRPLGLVHFDPGEFLFLGNSHHAPGRARGLNGLPPEGLWDNIKPTARVLDELRARLGVPVRILSAYRNEAYNRAVGGERNSMHMRFLACDITADGVEPRRVADELTRMRSERVLGFRGGIGRYATFTHVDTRGTDASWGGNGRGHGPVRAGRSAPAGDPRSSGVQALADRAFPLPPSLRRARSGPGVDPAPDLSEAAAAVNGPGVVAFDPELPAETRKAILYSTQFAQRAADARVSAVEDRIAWWGIYTAALRGVGWVTQGSDFRQAQSNKASASVDGLALDAISSFVGINKLAAIRSVLDSLRDAAEGDKRIALLDLFGAQGAGGMFQLGATEVVRGDVVLALGAVQFRNLDRKRRVVFVEWGAQESEFWVAAERMTLNLDFYRDVAQPIVEAKIKDDAEALILAFEVAEAVG